MHWDAILQPFPKLPVIFTADNRAALKYSAKACQLDNISSYISYCGVPPLPADLLGRFNLDPVLIIALLLLAGTHLFALNKLGDKSLRGYSLSGWGIAALALLSPLCALSVSLFAARVGQHMILILIAAPLIAMALPQHDTSFRRLVINSTAFTIALWFWHMPGPYMATFRSDFIYWAMHLSLFGSAILLWRDLLHHSLDKALTVMAASGFASVQMGLLGAVLTFAGTPLFPIHFDTAPIWGLSPLADQQLGGLLMWVPGLLFFLIAVWRSLVILLPEQAMLTKE